MKGGKHHWFCSPHPCPVVQAVCLIVLITLYMKSECSHFTDVGTEGAVPIPQPVLGRLWSPVLARGRVLGCWNIEILLMQAEGLGCSRPGMTQVSVWVMELVEDH